jgi:Transcriptional regulatory protein, C terminal/AAA-like domain
VTPSVELNFPNPIETRSDFFDREGQLRLIQDTLLSQLRRAVVVMGERVMGKTSLLNVVIEWAAESGFRTLQLPHVTTRDAFMSEILDGMAAEANTSLHRMGLRDRSGRLTLTTTTEFTRVAAQLSSAATGTFLLCLDELDSMLLKCSNDAAAEILDVILHVVAKTALPIKFVFTITRTAPQIMRADASPFLSAARIAELPPWTPAEVRDCVAYLVNDTLALDDEAHDLLYDGCGGHPYFIKAILYALRGLGRPAAGNRVREPDIRAAIDAATRLPEVDFTLDNIAGVHFSMDELRVLRRMATSPGPVGRADLGVPATVLHELVQRRYLRADESGRLVQAFGLFGAWLLGKPQLTGTAAGPPPPVQTADTDEIPILSIDAARRRAFLGDSEIQLTAQEYRFLSYLVGQAGTVVDRNTVAMEVWPDDRVMDSGREGRLDALVHRLREELGANASRYVQTRRGRGYYANPDHVRLIPGPRS